MAAAVRNTAAVELVEFAELSSTVRGTAVVESVTSEGAVSRVRMVYPLDRAVETVFPVPVPEASRVANDAGRALAVQLRVRGATVESSVLASSSRGPVRTEISLTQALGLAAAGIRAVVITV